MGRAAACRRALSLRLPDMALAGGAHVNLVATIAAGYSRGGALARPLRDQSRQMQRVVIALLSISLPLAFAALPGHAEAPPKVGVVTAVNPETTGSTAASAVRVIDLGNDVVFDEKIATGEAGQAQVFFLDQSSLSEITIDRFVYDPDRHAGALAIKIGEGLARYVGGRISKESDVTFTTPTG